MGGKAVAKGVGRCPLGELGLKLGTLPIFKCTLKKGIHSGFWDECLFSFRFYKKAPPDQGEGPMMYCVLWMRTGSGPFSAIHPFKSLLTTW
jgi:hypothetical protein